MLFISSYKLFSLLSYLNFSLGFLVMYKKRLDLKYQLNFKLYNVLTWLTKITVHILPNILQSKGNQTMKFGQLIEYNRETFFLKNHTQNVGEKLFQDPFLKNQS